MFFKRLEKQLEELQKRLDKVSAVADMNTRDKLNKAYSVMETTLDPLKNIVNCVKRNERESFISMRAAEELLEQLSTARKLIGEVIGEGGADDE